MSDRILVIDDEPAILAAMGSYFSELDYVVDCAKDRTEAERLLTEHSYACLIADVRLSAAGPQAGLEIVAAVRERHPTTRIIVLTAYGSPEVEEEARRCGADSFLHKPKLLQEVARVLAKVTGRAEKPEAKEGEP
jgi:CheY-like chemotaxis protein